MAASGVRARRAVEGIQRHLEAIYDVALPERAVDFLIGDKEFHEIDGAGALPAGVRRDLPEQLLVLGGGDGQGELGLALYLSDEVRRGLEDGATLQEHCHATEGVSHFLMLLWSGRQGRSLRMLDLELQAEIDKASTCLLLDRGSESGGRGGRVLLRRLFEGVRFDAGLGAEERERYRTAHRLAHGYSLHLAELLERGVDALLGELRELYRLPGEAKRERVLRKVA
jgi:hypothetical protein